MYYSAYNPGTGGGGGGAVDAGTLTGATLASNVTASSLTSVGTLAALTVTATIAGSVSGSSGSCTGNAATATKLAATKTINGTAFDGSANITVTADATTLTGSSLNTTVLGSSLTSVGTLTGLAVASGTITSSAPVSIAQTWNQGSTVFTAFSVNATNTASNVASLLINLLTSGSSKFSVDLNGNLNATSNITAGGTGSFFTASLNASGAYGWSAASKITCPSNGILLMTNSGATDFTRLCFGLTTSAAPALARNGAGLDFKLADNSDYTFATVSVLKVPSTITAPGTTGAQTINKAQGRVNIAAAGTSVTVTCSFCTVSSTVLAVCASNDATAKIKNVVPGAGSFVVTLDAAATAEVAISYLITN